MLLVFLLQNTYDDCTVIFKGKPSEHQQELSIVKRTFGQTMGSIVLFFFEVMQIAVFAIFAIVVIRMFVIKPFVVQGASMEPNFHDADYLIIDEITYYGREAKRGEVVVFHPPNESEDQYYIKRVIGLPGETVEIIDGKISVYNTAYPNGIELKEDYINEFTQGRLRITIGLDEYFLLGDNRDSSLDSRIFGPVPKENVIGRVLVRGLPLKNIGTIPRPVYTY